MSLCHYLIQRCWIGYWPWCIISIPVSKCSKWQGIWWQQKVFPQIWNCVSLLFDQMIPTDIMYRWLMKHCINGRRWFWGCKQAWCRRCSASWHVLTHFRGTCGIHGSTLSVVISLWWGWMASKYFIQCCCCVRCWCRFGWRPCGKIWTSKKASQCDNGWILGLSILILRHWWHCVASRWPIEATIHCGCLCGCWTKPLEVSTPKLEKTSCRSLSRPWRRHRRIWQYHCYHRIEDDSAIFFHKRSTSHGSELSICHGNLQMGLVPICVYYIHLQSLMAWD